MAVIKKKASKKTIAKKQKQSFKMRAGYVVVPSLLIGVILSILVVFDSHQKKMVLAAATHITTSGCSGKTTGMSCSFSSSRGKVSGTCQTPSGQNVLVCLSSNHIAPRE